MKSAFLNSWGEEPIFRILDFLIDNHIFDYSVTTVSKETNTAKKTVYKVFKRLIENNCLTQTRVEGRNILYKLNLKHPFVKNLIRMDYELTQLEMESKQVKIPEKKALLEAQA